MALSFQLKVDTSLAFLLVSKPSPCFLSSPRAKAGRSVGESQAENLTRHSAVRKEKKKNQSIGRQFFPMSENVAVRCLSVKERGRCQFSKAAEPLVVSVTRFGERS